ncbi:hypothetical protein GALMADRAFT_237973 [Galerina marginata CBS 339.88]|uniref:Peptidase A1 domain-containing protein n=1 Tax=Galerina marginata (strain CBS 339.88) TaxID=685588 RepID=A0A067THH1_GALM3|nr:hypothetical protein GALMADRAFT_237973 [Galerina marginata CBS 339.88]
MARFFVTYCLWTAALHDASQAIHVQVRGTREVVHNFRRPFIYRASGGLTLNNSGDISYYADIAVGNQSFQALIDTGSSDLWVAGKVANSSSTGLNTSIQYAANSIEGLIKHARLDFAGQTVSDQAFLEVSPNAKYPDGYGIIGLGPAEGSFISKMLASPAGSPVLDRLFMQNRTSPNYFTILLGRDRDPTDFFSGSITIGEVLNDYAGILNEPHLNITNVPDNMSDDQHLQILLDPDGVIGPNGKPIPIETEVDQTADKKQATVVFDCGFTLPQLPRSVVDQIYGNFYGAEFTQVPGLGGAWILPCDQEVNVTFSFAGRIYPIHPLDMSLEPSLVNVPDFKTVDGQRGCIGTFQPFTYDRGSSPNYDMVLGMAFMRNVYSLFDYGDKIANSTAFKSPYIQLHSITDKTEAHNDFVTVRLGGIDTTGSKGMKDRGSSHGQTTLYYVLAVVAAIALMIILTLLFFYVRRRRRM